MPALLFVDELFTYHLSCSATDIVHPPHPKHLVGGFELFSHTFLFGVFFYQPEKKLLRLFFGICEMGMEFAGSEQIVVQHLMMLFHISFVP